MADVLEATAAHGDGERGAATKDGPSLEELKRELLVLEQQRREWRAKQQSALLQKTALEHILQDHNVLALQQGTVAAPVTQSTDQSSADNERKNTVAMRKEELRQLQGQTIAVLKKQQEAASALTKQLEHLNGKATAASDQTVPNNSALPLKRKRDGDQDYNANPPRMGSEPAPQLHGAKQHDLSVSATALPRKLHEFAPASDLLTTSADGEQSALFRIATRYLLQTNERISSTLLAQKYEAYTGKRVESEVVEDFVSSFPFRSHRLERAARWCPGAANLMFPTFRSNDDDARALEEFIQLEKQVVEDVCLMASIQNEALSEQQTIMKRLLGSIRQANFVANLFGLSYDSKTPPPASVYSALSNVIGGNLLQSSQQRRIRYHRFRQFSGLFIEMETWLRTMKTAEEDTNGAVSQVNASKSMMAQSSAATASNRPFDLEQDSVFRQLRSFALGAAEQATKAKKRKKLNPMDIMCFYELNGVCNDENCPYQHQKDFGSSEDEASNENKHTPLAKANSDAALLSREQMDFLLDFAQLRSKVQKKWPLITGQTSTVTEAETAAVDITQEDKQQLNDEPLHPSESANAEEDGSFLQLENSDNAAEGTNKTENTSSRYYGANEDTGLSQEALQKRVNANPHDVDSWLLLAINQLGFDVNLSDDAIRVSNSARVLEQLRNLYRCVHLSAFSNSASIDDSKLKLSIHTLSRALEIEENASCEALWLLYLHLSSLLPNRDFDSEFEMAEQAMNCIAASHELWIHYVAVGKLDSIQVSEELHCRILWHLSKPDFGAQHDESKKSRLLISTLFHMCVKLCHAGDRARAVELVAAILQLKQLDGLEPEWCKGVRSQLNCSDVAILSMTFAHLMLFLEMPRCIEMWLRVSGHQQVHISSFAYSAELFEEYQAHFKSLPNEDINFSIAAYELAFTRMKSQSSQEWYRFMDVILNNWMLLVAFQDIKKHGDTRSGVELFLEEHRTEIVKCPGASFSIAKLLAKQQERILHAHQLMVDVMNQSSMEQFPEALHYYLFACQGFSGADPPDTDFPALLDVVVRLSRSLDVNHEEIQQSIADIRVDTNPFGKVKALKKLLYGLLSVWMDQLAATSSQSNKQPNYLEEEFVNVFAALDICQLMSMLLEPSVAIEGLDLVLSSSKFRMLSSESRQFAWALRFIFQLDRSVRAKPRPESFRPVRSALLQLFHRYLECMNTVTECTMQASHRLSEAVEHRGVQAAIIECLYPQQKPWNVLDGNLEIFQLCLAATPPLELSSLFGSTYYAFSPAPVFCLAYADIATHRWEWRKIRQGLSKCLASTTTHDQALRALVALELKNQNVKGVARLLERDLHMDPLSLETWRLVIGMEILFGEHSKSTRLSGLTKEMKTKRKLIFSANSYNDFELFEDASKDMLAKIEVASAAKDTSLSLVAQNLHCVPNAVLMMRHLTHLDLSGNDLVNFPESICQLTKLTVLKVAQNSLIELPSSLAKLSELRVLDVSHNNLSTIPGTLWVHLVKIQELYLSANVLIHLPAPPLARLRDLRVLKIENNILSGENMKQICELLSAKCIITDVSTDIVNNGDKGEVAKDHEDLVRHTQVRIDLSDERNDDEEDGFVMFDSSGHPVRNHEERDAGEGCRSSNGEKVNEKLQDEQEQSQNIEMAGIVNQASRGILEAIRTESPEDGEVVEAEQSSVHTSQEPNGITEDGAEDWSLEQPSTSKAILPVELPSQANDTPTSDELEIFRATELSDKFEAFINENHVSRCQVKQRNPVLWRKYVEAQVQLYSGLGHCVMCDAPNEGWNQRFNTMVLCPSCLSCAVNMLQARASASSLEVSESKEEEN